MNTETINYKGFSIKIIQDDSPMNPFEDWDCEPSLMVEAGRNYSHDYSKGEIDRYLWSCLSDNQIKKYQKLIITDFLDMSIEQFNEDYPKKEYTAKERIDILRDKLNEFTSESLDNKEKFCVEFNINHYRGTSRGYSQGDWADVFIIITDKDRERLGIKPKHDKEVLKGTFNLYGYWAWGDVYGYQIEDKDGNDLDSCWGYYGDNHKESGLIDAAENVIDCYISGKIKEHCKQVKAYIKNHVPLEKREALTI